MSNGTIVRVKKDRNYTVMSNIPLRDSELSWKAKGLLCFMLSLPPEWDFSIAGLVSCGKGGREEVRSILAELEEHGYLRREQFRDGGKFGAARYFIDEGGFLNRYQNADSPLSENPTSVFTTSENHLQINTNLNKYFNRINTNTAAEPKTTYKKRAKKATLEEIKAYVSEKRLSVDPQQFFDYFEAGEWHDSKGNPVLNWKQKLLTWAKHGNGKPAQAPQSSSWSTPKPTDQALLDAYRKEAEDFLNGK